MECQLCGVALNDENSCKSHIMPRGILKYMSPSELGNLMIVGTDMDNRRPSPGGLYDKDILCRSCDNSIGTYDDYALEFISKNELIDHPSGVGWVVKGADNQKLKLFCLSYLWRASLTKMPEFKGVNLGKKHENAIRQLIISGKSGSCDDYTSVFAKFSNEDDSFGAVMFPAKVRINKIAYYEAYLPKLYKFWVKVDSQNDKNLSYMSLGYDDDIFIHNKGDFSASLEKKIMIDVVRKSR